MKYLIILWLLVNSMAAAHGQLPGFPLHANGLLYDDTLMKCLRHLADSARSAIGQSPVGNANYSPSQTTGRLVRLDTGDLYGALNDLRKGISFDAFVRKYPQAAMDDKILVTLDERPGYHVARVATYYNITAIMAKEGYYNAAVRIILPAENAGINGDCVYSLNTEPHIHRGKITNDAYVFAFYLNGNPTVIRLPETAARLVGYRDRLLDSSIGVYYKDARIAPPWVEGLEFGPAQKTFDDYIDRKGDSSVAVYRTRNPYKYPKNALMEDFEVKRRYTDSLAAVDMERYMDTFSPPAALEIRRRWVHAMTDNFDELTPRLYAMHIAYLAAELGNWPVFLQAQLSVAIDPTGHYPDSKRREYRSCFLRELEALDIGVDDILLGNELNSPWGIDPGFIRCKRLGRTLALEGGDRQRLEDEVLQLIADKGLDDYNRLAMHYLFLNYVSFLPDGDERNKALTGLERADGSLPEYLSARVRGEKEAVSNRRDLN